jgi:anthranilate synthase component 1
MRSARKSVPADPLAFVQDYLARFRTAEDARLPRFLRWSRGLLWLRHRAYVEKRLAGTTKPDPLAFRTSCFWFQKKSRSSITCPGKLSLVVYATPGETGAYRRAQERLVELLQKLRTAVEIPADNARPVRACRIRLR